MDVLVMALGPAFAAGLAVQQFLEFASPVVDMMKKDKKLIMSLAAVLLGLALAFGAGIRVLQPLGLEKAGIFDPLVSGLIISAGTEGLNSILKFLGYARDKKRKDASCACEED